MNLLPFVIGFLILFAALNTHVFQNVRNVLTMQNAYHTMMHTERKARKRAITRTFEKIKKRREPDKDKPEPKPQPPKILRTQPQYASNARINLYALLFEETPPLGLEEAATKLLQSYYDVPETFLSTVKKAAQAHIQEGEKPKTLLFREIKIKDEVYYKLCRGTSYYCAKDRIGYPPIDSLFRIEASGADKPLRWRTANPETLTAFFGPSLTHELLEFERQLHADEKQLTRGALNDFFGQNPGFTGNLDNVKALLDNGCGPIRATTAITYDDEKNLARIEKEYISLQ